MKKALIIVVFFLFSKIIFAQNEIEPEGDKLIWFILVIVALGILFLIAKKTGKKGGSSVKKPFLQWRRLHIELDKDRMYYPDKLTLAIKNSGNTDVDLDKPLLVFDNFWLKRKFKLKGMGNRTFYPLYLEKGKTHNLQIELNGFYLHDKSLKKFPKAKVIVYDIKGKRLGSKSVFLRKTLFKF